MPTPGDPPPKRCFRGFFTVVWFYCWDAEQLALTCVKPTGLEPIALGGPVNMSSATRCEHGKDSPKRNFLRWVGEKHFAHSAPHLDLTHDILTRLRTGTLPCLCRVDQAHDTPRFTTGCLASAAGGPTQETQVWISSSGAALTGPTHHTPISGTGCWASAGNIPRSCLVYS